MTYVAAVAGASGYAGGELLRLLLGHGSIQIGPVVGGSKAGQTLGEVHPQLPELADTRLMATDPDVLGAADIVFLALPHGQSAAIARALPADLPVVDLGADFRLGDEGAWKAFYNDSYAGHWLYGLPELPGVRPQIAEATRVANPGCYPTSVAIAMAPLLAEGLVGDVVTVVAASGTSGAGRSPSETLLASQVMGSMSPYKVGGVHQHTPEMEQTLSHAAGRDIAVSFTPLLAPMPRGILATCSVDLGEGVTTDDLRECLHASYVAERFVTVLADGRWPQTSSTVGGNSVHLQAAADVRTGRAIVVAALDNLVKGAAGQALQNANLMLGLPEGEGLTDTGVTP
ncbi:MAG: N-acetyl-gamma-glutamyl-phosphate reductase [Candidatus Nanopelagicales bacterium]|jgi:N-acetyl-gamma-glutamyl-phosphate reductase